METGRTKRFLQGDPDMTSNRPIRQTTFDFLTEADPLAAAPEPQRGESVLAAMPTTTLSDSSLSLMEQIVDPANFEKAWRNVRANRGAPGPDGITLAEFPEIFRQQWPTLRQQLLDGTYQPQPARRKSIPKPDGGQRDLGIPNVIDRLIQQAVLQILTPIFDPGFSASSFGFRPGRSAQQAAQQVQSHIRAGYRHCVDMDLSKFFDRVQHDVLMTRVARQVHDKRLLKLIGRYLRAGVLVGVDLQPSIEGTMQGGPLSPILANILLDDFDQELERRGLHFVRYADDFLVFTKTNAAARRVFESVGRYLTRQLKLVVNLQKSRTCRTDGVEFLGFQFTGYGGQIRVSPKNVLKFQDRVREITRRNRGVSIERRYQELRWYFQGWVGYFSIVPLKSFFDELDQWVRRRLRSCYWKQWKHPRTRVSKLLKLGVSVKEAKTHGSSSKGPWVMSSSRAVHQALSVEYLTRAGLVNLKEIWRKLTAKRRIA
jgi:RNA-directed DNA polymerase